MKNKFKKASHALSQVTILYGCINWLSLVLRFVDSDGYMHEECLGFNQPRSQGLFPGLGWGGKREKKSQGKDPGNEVGIQQSAENNRGGDR